MFRFLGTTGRASFAIGIAIRVGLFAAATILFPWALVSYASGSGCSGVSGACGAVGLIFSMTYKPLAFALFLISLPALLARRLRDIGVSPWWSLVILLLILADNQFLIFAGTPWSFGFSGGVLSLTAPYFAYFALALFVVLSILPGRPGRIGFKSLGWPVWLCLVLAAPIALFAAIACLASYQPFHVAVGGLLSRAIFLYRLEQFEPIFMAALLPSIVLTLWPRRGETVDAAKSSAKPDPLPYVTLALIALGVTIVVLAVDLPPEMLGALLLVVAPITLPTYVFYLAIAFAGYLVIWRRSVPGMVLAIFCALLVGHWAFQRVSALTSPAEDARVVASIPVTPLSGPHPRDVFVAGSAEFTSMLLRRSDVDWVYEERRKGQYVKYQASHDPSKSVISRKSIPANGLPATYLALKTSTTSSFADDTMRYVAQGPFELRLEDRGTDQLVAVWYEREVQPPAPLPAVAGYGWLADTKGINSDDIQKLRDGFLTKALGPAQ